MNAATRGIRNSRKNRRVIVKFSATQPALAAAETPIEKIPSFFPDPD
jgi:hypothetical protein